VVQVQVEALEVGAVATRRGALAVAVRVEVADVEKQLAAERGRAHRGVGGVCAAGQGECEKKGGAGPRRGATEQGGNSHGGS
jgi:hypothetical protein